MYGVAVTLAFLTAVGGGAQEIGVDDACAISGVVLDPDGEPMRDLEVPIYWYTYDTGQPPRRRIGRGGGDRTTGPEGEFEFSEVVPGFVQLYATVPGMLRAISELVELKPGEALTDFRLQSPGYGGSIVGTVTDEAGMPVEGAVVNYGSAADEEDIAQALTAAEEGRYSTRTDRDGWFGIDTIGPVKANLSVYVWGYPRLHVPGIEIVEGGEVCLDLVLRRCLPDTWTLAGAVTDAEGLGPPGVDIQIVFRAPDEDGQERQHTRQLTTGDLGDFLAYGLPPDTPIWIRAYDPGRGLWEGTISAEADAYQEQTVVLEPGVALAGTVRGPDDEPLANAELTVNLTRRDETQPVALPSIDLDTDEGGRYRLVGLPPGEWTLRAPRRGWRTYHSTPFTVSTADDEVRHDIRFPPGGTIAGIIVGPDGQPVTNARAHAFADEEGRIRPSFARQTPGAAFRFESLEPGGYSLAVWAPGFWPATVPVELGDGDDLTDVEVLLGEGPSISGVVLGEDGQPVPGIGVMLDYRRVAAARATMAFVYASANELARTDQDGAFTIRGVQVEEVGLLAVGLPSRSAQRYRPTAEPEGDEGAAVRRLRVPCRLTDGTYAEAGGVLVSLRDGQDVTGAEIRLAKFVSDEDLCLLRGRIADPASQLAAGLPVKVAVSEDPLGPGQVMQRKRGLSVRTDVALADGDGRFEIPNIVPGEYYIVVGAGAAFYHVGQVTLSPGEQAEIGELPIPMPGALRGAVSDEKGDPITEGWVVAARVPHEARTLWNDGASPRIVRAPIGGDGSYQLDGLGPGFWFVMTIGDRLPGSAIKQVFVNGTTGVLDFHHAYPGRIAGRVVDADGNPVPKAVVRCEGERYSWTVTARSDQEGRYEVTSLPAGSYTLRAIHSMFLPSSEQTVTVLEEAGPPAPDLVLHPGGFIRGSVAGTDGVALKDGSRRIAAEVRRNGQRMRPLLVREDGSFVSQALEPGTYTVTARLRGSQWQGEASSEPIALAAGQTVRDVVVELPEATPK